MRKQTVAILYGGKSGEHEVSQRSAASVLKHLDRSAWEPLLIGIDYDGVWYIQNAEQNSFQGESLPIRTDASSVVSVVPGKGLFSATGRLRVDSVFPVLHGTFGEDGTVQGLLELCDLPYVGAGLTASAISMDKEKTKQIWEHAGLPVVPWITLMKWEFLSMNNRMEDLDTRISSRFGYPVFVKPASSGSSVGVSRVDGVQELEAALREAFTFDVKVLVEAGISAREIECSVTGMFSEYTAYTPGEIVPSHEFYDYDAKYLDPEGAALRIPAGLPGPELEKVRTLALTAFRALGCEGMARIDFFVDRNTGALYLNEINTIPGFTSISMFPRMCEASGLPYGELITRLLEMSFNRYNEKKKIRYRK